MEQGADAPLDVRPPSSLLWGRRPALTLKGPRRFPSWPSCFFRNGPRVLEGIRCVAYHVSWRLDLAELLCQLRPGGGRRRIEEPCCRRKSVRRHRRRSGRRPRSPNCKPPFPSATLERIGRPDAGNTPRVPGPSLAACQPSAIPHPPEEAHSQEEPWPPSQPMKGHQRPASDRCMKHFV